MELLWLTIACMTGYIIGYIRCYFVLRKIIAKTSKAELWRWVQTQ